jgi:hypothetical protein
MSALAMRTETAVMYSTAHVFKHTGGLKINHLMDPDVLYVDTVSQISIQTTWV